MPLQIQLKAYADAVNARLEMLLPPAARAPELLHEAMRYSCLAPGKRMRPAMCIASAEAVGGDSRVAVDAACAIEMVHCFSLIHDDLPAIDDDDLRRGLPSCHKRFGEAIALLAGDALFALAFQVISNAPIASNAEHTLRVLQCVQVLTKAAGSDGLVGGEVVDVLSEGRPIDAEQLRYIHSRKTGALISASCEIGGILGGGSESQIQCLKTFGERVGLAFQIADDVLNETSDPVKLGKAVGSDRERSKATYTVLYGIDKAMEMAEQTASQAKATLNELGGHPFLSHLADYSVQRLH